MPAVYNLESLTQPHLFPLCPLACNTCAVLPFIFDHQTYMGIDMDNRRCAVDNSVFAAGQNANLPYCLGV